MMRRALLLSTIPVLALLSGCDNAESQRVEGIRTKLSGTWLHEVEGEGAKSRRVVVLGSDGKFIDRVAVLVPGKEAERVELAGEWSYDGINLKRRYLQENGRQFSGGMRFATFPMISVTDSELVLDDSIAGRRVTYRRVAEGTRP